MAQLINGKKKVIDLLDCFTQGIFKEKAGNTTRLVDFAIQLVFNGYRVIIKDHKNNGNDSTANDCLYKKILRRLQIEHVQLLNDHRILTHSYHGIYEIELVD